MIFPLENGLSDNMRGLQRIKFKNFIGETEIEREREGTFGNLERPFLGKISPKRA